jgi:hypothetical protein
MTGYDSFEELSESGSQSDRGGGVPFAFDAMAAPASSSEAEAGDDWGRGREAEAGSGTGADWGAAGGFGGFVPPEGGGFTRGT